MCSRADQASHPPPLPAKQRRSTYSRGSSTGSSMDLEPEGGKYIPLGALQETETPTFSDVFSESTDCHALRCPIHHNNGHQERFLSEGCPPPVPKKRLTRALSLPGGCAYPQCYLPSKHQNYDNPLYMLTPIRDSQPDTEKEDQPGGFKTQAPRQPLGLLNFDTPDHQLPSFFRCFHDQERVSLEIQECHLLFLRRITRQLDTLSLVEAQSGIESFEPQEFQLCEGYQSKKIGGAVFYPVRCPRLPGRVLSAKVYRPNSGGAVSMFPNPLPPHINIQQLLVHFPRCSEPVRHISVENLQDASSNAGPEHCERLSLHSPDGGSAELNQQQGAPSEHECDTVVSLMSEGFEVDIERELPQGTLEDFIREGASLQRSRPQAYERWLGILLVQIAQGLLHMRRHGAICTELAPRDVILTWRGIKQGVEPSQGTGAERESGMLSQRTREREAVGGGISGGAIKELESGEGVTENLSTPIEILWNRWGPPRAVITAVRPRRDDDQSVDSEEVQFRRLLMLCLNLPESPVTLDQKPSTRNQQGTPFPPELLQQVLSLLDPQSGVRLADATLNLQAFLWGPHTEFLQQTQPTTWPTLLANWLSVKRSLLVQRLSELALTEAEIYPDLEDNLCLQYLSTVEPEHLLKVSALWQLHETAP
ncbi:hypothetical protein GJAV_G00073410 [Gymnothorax javanicus]|nr:hypothetical protein GJAV_G00073410 [Gymnothorax javanicus]